MAISGARGHRRSRQRQLSAELLSNTRHASVERGRGAQRNSTAARAAYARNEAARRTREAPRWGNDLNARPNVIDHARRSTGSARPRSPSGRDAGRPTREHSRPGSRDDGRRAAFLFSDAQVFGPRARGEISRAPSARPDVSSSYFSRFTLSTISFLGARPAIARPAAVPPSPFSIDAHSTSKRIRYIIRNLHAFEKDGLGPIKKK